MASKERIQRVLSIGVTADTTEARSHLAALDRVLRQTEALETRRKQMAILNAEFKAGEVSQQKYARAMAILDSQSTKARMAMIGRTSPTLPETPGGSLAAISRRFAPFAMAAGVGEGLRRSVLQHADYEAQLKRFEVMTGSPNEANRVMAGLRIPGVSFSATQVAARNLLQYDMDSRAVPNTVRQLAAIASGDAEQLKNLSLAFAQTQGAGRLMGQELLQMVNAGFNPLMEISKRTGETMGDLKKRMEAGGISSREVADAFKSATSEGGRFNGMLESMANTTAGQMARARSSIEMLGVSVGKAFSPATKGAIAEFTLVMQSLNHQVEKMTREGPQIRVGNFDEWQSKVREMEQHRSTLVGGIANWFNSSDEIAKQDRAIRMAKEASRISELRRRDPAELTQDQRDAIRLADQFERKAKLTTDEEFRIAKERYNEQMATVNGDEERAKLRADMLERHGAGRFTEAALGEARNAQKYLDARADEKRVGEVFNNPIQSARGRIIDARYGDDADSVKALYQQSAGDERRAIDKLIEHGASYEAIRDAANETARVEADRLSAMEKSARVLSEQSKDAERLKRDEEKRAEKYKDRLADLDSEVQYRRDLITLGRDEAEIARKIRDDGLSRADAEALQSRQRRIELLSDTPKVGNVRAPKAVQAGSQEAYGLMAESMAASEGEQIRLLKEQVRKQQLQIATAQKTNLLIEQMETV